MPTGGHMRVNGLDEQSGQASSGRGQGGRHSAVGHGEGVLQAHQHELGAGVESIPAVRDTGL